MTNAPEMTEAPKQVSNARPAAHGLNRWAIGGLMVAATGVVAGITVGAAYLNSGPVVAKAQPVERSGEPRLPPGLSANYEDIKNPPPAEVETVAPQQAPQQTYQQQATGGGSGSGFSKADYLREARMADIKPFKFVSHEEEGGGSGSGEGRSGALFSQQRLTKPFPCQVDAATNIPAHLEGKLKSEAPGIISAITVKDVWSSDKRCLAIPRGTRFVGSYATKVEEGQARMGIIWTGLTRPHPKGDTIHLEGTVAGEPDGTAGVEGEVNTHFWRKFAGVAASTMIDLGKTVVTAGGEGGIGAAVAGIFAERGSRPLDEWAMRQLNIPNTIEVGPKSKGRAREISIVLAQHQPMSEFRTRR